MNLVSLLTCPRIDHAVWRNSDRGTPHYDRSRVEQASTDAINIDAYFITTLNNTLK